MMLQGFKFCALQAYKRFVIVFDPLGLVPQLYWTLPIFWDTLEDQGAGYVPVFRSSNTVVLTVFFFFFSFISEVSYRGWAGTWNIEDYYKKPHTLTSKPLRQPRNSVNFCFSLFLKNPGLLTLVTSVENPVIEIRHCNGGHTQPPKRHVDLLWNLDYFRHCTFCNCYELGVIRRRLPTSGAQVQSMWVLWCTKCHWTGLSATDSDFLCRLSFHQCFVFKFIYPYLCKSRSIFPTPPFYFSFFLFHGGTPTHENENKPKRQMVMHGDYSSNWRTEIFAVFRGAFGFFNCISKFFIYLFHDFLWKPWRCFAEPWLGNTGLDTNSVAK